VIELTFNRYSLPIAIATVIAIVFGLLLLFSRNRNNNADRYLALILIIIALWNTSLLILDLGLYRYAAGIIWIPFNYTLALGPCFYFYVRYMTNTELLSEQTIWPHFVPVILEVCLFFIEVYQGIPQSIGYYQTEIYKVFNPFINVAALGSFILYGYIARQRIQHYHLWVKNNFSHYHRYTLNWLSRLSSLLLALFTTWSLYLLMNYFLFNQELIIFDYYYFHLLLAFSSIWLSVEAFYKPNIAYPDVATDLKKEPNSNSIPNFELKEKSEWLKTQIEKNNLYLDPELSLRSLAEKLEIHPNFLSRIINVGFNQTFSDCINGYRVKAVLHILEDRTNDHRTFLAIAFDCGFNSKTTFNRIFKKQIGQTPLQFRNNLTKSK